MKWAKKKNRVYIYTNTYICIYNKEINKQPETQGNNKDDKMGQKE